MQVFQEKNYFIFNDVIFHIKNLEIKNKSVFLIIGCSKVEKNRDYPFMDSPANKHTKQQP